MTATKITMKKNVEKFGLEPSWPSCLKRFLSELISPPAWSGTSAI